MNLLILLLSLLPAGLSPPAPEDSLLIRTTATTLDVDLYGRITLLDARNNTVTLWSGNGAAERTVGGTGWGNDQFDGPAAIWMRNGMDIFVADCNNHRIQRFDRNLNFVSSLSTRETPDENERFGYPTDVALSRLGDLYVCDTENSRILKFDRMSRVDRTFGGIGSGRGRLRRPTQLEIGPSDKVYVLDAGGVQVFDGFGNFLRTITDTTFGKGTMISADQNGLAVLTPFTVLFFDRDDLPAGMLYIPVEGEAAEPGARALTVRDGDVYLLTHEGVHRLQGAREAVLTK